MNMFPDHTLVLAALATLTIGVVLTPIFGLWVWIAILLPVWWLCLDNNWNWPISA